MTHDDEFEKAVLDHLAGRIDISQTYPGSSVVNCDEVAEYLGWPKIDSAVPDLRIHPETGENSLIAAWRISAERETFYCNGAWIISVQRKMEEWKRLEESSGHQRYSPPDFGYSSWHCSWCGASFWGDMPEDTPNPQTIRCEKDRYIGRPLVIDMVGFNPDEWS